MIPLVDLKAQYATVQEQVERAVLDVMASGHYVLGPRLKEFEAAFAAACGTAHAVGLNSGTSAIHLAILALGLGPGDEVITVSHTFIATVNAVRYSGALPVFVDVDPATSTMDVNQVAAAITPRTRAIMPVHLYGRCADMDPILALAAEHGLDVIEDAAQAHLASSQGRRAGSMGRVGCFSFYPAKNLGAYGEGGALVTNDAELAARVRLLRDHGQSKRYHHDVLGFNHRLEEIQAAVLGVKLPHLEAWNQARRRLADAYVEGLAGSGVRVDDDPRLEGSAHHIFPVYTGDRDGLAARLLERGVATGIHYPVPAHLQPAHADLGYGPGSLPVTERLAAEELSLPLFPELTGEDQATVVAAVRELA